MFENRSKYFYAGAVAAPLFVAVWFMARWLGLWPVLIVQEVCIFVWTCWVLYLAVMNLHGAETVVVNGEKKKVPLPPLAEFMGASVLVIGLLWDAALNILLASVVFIQLPRNTKLVLLTARLKEYDAAPRETRLARWRYAVTRLLADQLLDRFDPAGKHV